MPIRSQILCSGLLTKRIDVAPNKSHIMRNMASRPKRLLNLAKKFLERNPSSIFGASKPIFIIALAFISLTYGKWFEGRKSYKLKLTKDLSDKNTKLNELMLENKNLFEDLKQLNSEFLNCMKFKPDTELKSEKTALRQFSIKLKELIREHKNIPDWTPHLDEFDLEASFQSHVDQYQKLKEETQRLCNNLSSEIDIFKKKTESIVVADMNIEEVKHRHCLHCGNEVYESTFCSSCGKHTSEIKTCDSCKKETILAQFNQYVNRPQKTCCYHCGVPHKEEAIPIS